MQDMIEKRFVVSDECASRMGFGRQYLRREIKAGNVPVIRVGRKVLVDMVEFERLLSQRARSSLNAK